MGVASTVVRVLDVCVLIVSAVFVVVYALVTSSLKGTLDLPGSGGSGVNFVALLLACVILPTVATIAHLVAYRERSDASLRAIDAHAFAGVGAASLWAHAGLTSPLYHSKLMAVLAWGPAILVAVRGAILVAGTLSAVGARLPTRRNVRDAVTTYIVLALSVFLTVALAWALFALAVMPGGTVTLFVLSLLNACTWTALVGTYIALGWSEAALASPALHRAHALVGVCASYLMAATLGAALVSAVLHTTSTMAIAFWTSAGGAAFAIAATVSENVIIYRAFALPEDLFESEDDEKRM